MGTMRIGGRAIRYSQFVPQLYNLCRELGFAPRLMMPSRAFCSDENQGYPVVLIAQHFGTFPFDHGRVGGKVAIDRHAPFSHHGEDLVIVQASPVGYDPAQRRYGHYRRSRTASGGCSSSCGKLAAVLEWYQGEYDAARDNVRLEMRDRQPLVVIDNALLDMTRPEGLMLALGRIIDPASNAPSCVLSTAKGFALAPALHERFVTQGWAGEARSLGSLLTADLFLFSRTPSAAHEGHDLLEFALQSAMPSLVTSRSPMLDAARIHTQLEFDRTYRSILRERAFTGKNLIFVSGLNVDISPPDHLQFPLTKFVPWAAWVQLRDGRRMLLEQDALYETLCRQPSDNPDMTAFDTAIAAMATSSTIELPEC